MNAGKSYQLKQQLEQLKTGHQEYLNKISNNSYQLVDKQTPSAIVLGCSDSRVPVELIFNQTIGDLFVIRVAGNVATPSQVGTIEFGVTEFNIPLIIVLGHTQCGAIKSAIALKEKPQVISPNLTPVIDFIQPSLEKYRHSSNQPLTTHTDQIIKGNIETTIKTIEQSPILAPLFEKKELLITGALYSIETGRLDFLKREG